LRILPNYQVQIWSRTDSEEPEPVRNIMDIEDSEPT